MKFYEKLFELRKKEGLSQEELAEKVNVSRQTVSKWESGQSSPEMDKLLILSHLFNISIDELVGKQKDEEKKKDNTPSRIKYKSLKIVIILLLIYLTIAIFKYISLTIMNNIGNSFRHYFITCCVWEQCINRSSNKQYARQHHGIYEYRCSDYKFRR